VIGISAIIATGAMLARPGTERDASVADPSLAPVSDTLPGARGQTLSVRDDEVIVFASDVDGDYDLYVVDGSGRRPRRLTDSDQDERAPAISPDGKTIAYAVGSEPRRDIWLMDADGRRQRSLVTHPADDSNPAWSSDGRSLAFHSTRNDLDRDIFEIRDRGSGLRQGNVRARARDPAVEQQPSWAPGTRRVAISASYAGGVPDIYIVDMDDPRSRQRRTSTGDWDLNPAFSPNGGKIAFTRRPFCSTCDGQKGTADLYIVEPGRSAHALTSTPLRDEKDATWAPDGRAIAYVAGPGDATQLWVMTPDGKRARPLVAGYVSVIEPAWGRRPSPAGRSSGSTEPET
jgi:TolB protein